MRPEPGPVSVHAAHFDSEEARQGAVHLGMWVFLGSELLLFAALFTSYAVFRLCYPDVFREGQHHMDVGLGTLNTFVLVTSSILVALGVWAVREGRRGWSSVLLLGAAALGLGFLGVKAVEYQHHIQEGALPGGLYASAALAKPGASLFFTLYFLLTGLHALHVAVGVVLLGVLAFQVAAGRWGRVEHSGVELGGMYWHFVDIVWLFLWPLLYLV